MTSNTYHFITHWRMRSTREEIYEVLSDAADLTRWWPSVYLKVQVLEPGDEQGIGRVVSLYTKGWLPYTLRCSPEEGSRIAKPPRPTFERLIARS